VSGTTLDDYTDLYAQRVHGMKASEIRALFSVANRPEVVSLAGGSPFTAALPLDAIGDMVGDLLHREGAAALNYGIGQGELALREQICQVMALEGIDASVGASPDDVVVTTGSQQALDLVSRIFLDPGDVVLAEAPSYVGALGVFQAAQAEVRHVPMDDDGLIPEALEQAIAAVTATGRRAKFLYTVPAFHNPAGITLAEERRDKILEIAQRHRLLVLEDNPYGLLGFDSQPPAPLRARAREGVLYLGTFSKTFGSGIRIGWVLAPHAVREKLVMAAEAAILCPSMLNQRVATRYFTTMPWQQQLKVFQELYRDRRDTMLTALDDFLPTGTGMRWTRPGGGFYVWVTLPAGLDAKAMVPRAINARVAYVPGTGFYADGGGHQHLRLSYCFPPPERIREGVRRLAGVISEEMDLRDMFGTGRPAGGPAAGDAAGTPRRPGAINDVPDPGLA
jgi:2-aminoadipate transaminase